MDTASERGMTRVMEQRRRKEERIAAALPVRGGQFQGVTRDVSASGVYFETVVPFTASSEVAFHIELDSSAGKLRLLCRGSVIRVESKGDKTGVAVKITESRLEEARSG
jgi:hypothetical protein